MRAGLRGLATAGLALDNAHPVAERVEQIATVGVHGQRLGRVRARVRARFRFRVGVGVGVRVRVRVRVRGQG